MPQKQTIQHQWWLGQVAETAAHREIHPSTPGRQSTRTLYGHTRVSTEYNLVYMHLRSRQNYNNTRDWEKKKSLHAWGLLQQTAGSWVLPRNYTLFGHLLRKRTWEQRESRAESPTWRSLIHRYMHESIIITTPNCMKRTSKMLNGTYISSMIPPQWDNLVLSDGLVFFLKPIIPNATPTSTRTMVIRDREHITIPNAYLQMRIEIKLHIHVLIYGLYAYTCIHHTAGCNQIPDWWRILECSRRPELGETCWILFYWSLLQCLWKHSHLRVGGIGPYLELHLETINNVNLSVKLDYIYNIIGLSYLRIEN